MNSPNRDQITLRLPENLNEKIKNQAQFLGISKNALVIMLLSQALTSERQSDPNPAA